MKTVVGVIAALFLLGCQTPGLPAHSGGSPAAVPVTAQGAQMQTGQQGQVGETNTQVGYQNPTQYSFTLVGEKSRLQIQISKDGTVIDAKAEGVTAEALAASIRAGSQTVSYGEEAFRQSQSSGGAGAAGVEGGAQTTGRNGGGGSAGAAEPEKKIE